MKIDLIIVNYRSAHEVREALAHLGPWPEGTVTVVDNSEDPAQAQCLNGLVGAEAATGLRVRVAPRNLGFAAGCNLAWQETQAPHVLLLNPDARIRGEAVRHLAQYLIDAPDVAAVSPRTDWDDLGGFVLPRPEDQNPVTWLARSAQARWYRGWWAQRAVRHTQREMVSHRPLRVHSLAGAVLLLKRQAVEQAGGLFDERYFMFYEDTDLSRRLRRIGHHLMIDPRARAVHTWRHAAHKGPLMEQARALYLQRHYPWWQGLDRLVGRWESGQVATQHRLAAPSLVLHSAAQAAQALGAVTAFSPSPRCQPALVRPGAPAPFSPAEWALLEPATYWALCGPKWVAFEVRRDG